MKKNVFYPLLMTLAFLSASFFNVNAATNSFANGYIFNTSNFQAWLQKFNGSNIIIANALSPAPPINSNSRSFSVFSVDNTFTVKTSTAGCTMNYSDLCPTSCDNPLTPASLVPGRGGDPVVAFVCSDVSNQVNLANLAYYYSTQPAFNTIQISASDISYIMSVAAANYPYIYLQVSASAPYILSLVPVDASNKLHNGMTLQTARFTMFDFSKVNN